MKKRCFLLAMALGLSLALPAQAAEKREAPTLNAGFSGATYVSEEGDLWAWGDGYRTTPVRITEGLGVSKTAVPGEPAMLVRQDGTFLFFTGGFFEDSGMPIAYHAQKAANDYWNQSYYVLNNGYLHGWGRNGYGVLSPGGMKLWAYDNHALPLMADISDFEALGGAVLALDTQGGLWSWGKDEFGRLGTGEQGDAVDEYYFSYRAVPQKVMDDVARMSLGVNSALAVKTDGTLWFWGLQEDGLVTAEQCDKVDEFDQPYSSVPIQVMEGVLDAKIGHGTAYIIKEDHSLWTCGGNNFGEAGVGSTERVMTPTKIMEDVKQVAAGECFAVVEKLDGTLWAFGHNGYGRLGNGYVGDGESVLGPYQTTPTQIIFPAYTKSKGTAYATTQSILVDGKPVTFETYALKDAEGNDTNYIKVRDLAYVLNGTAAQFEVGWDGKVSLTAGQSYTPNGSEMSTPYSGDRAYYLSTQTTIINGEEQAPIPIVLQDEEGNGYTYYQLRQLGSLLGFTVDWSAEKGIFIETE